MDTFFVLRRLFLTLGKLVACTASLSLAVPAPAFADLLDERKALVEQFINDMHADPLVADCAAHGNFIASTSTAFERVEFLPSSFDSAHAAVTPWNNSFDQNKQRVTVDNIVTVEGLGIRKDGSSPTNLKFRCGYVETQMLAFSWNDPVPPIKPRVAHQPATKKKIKGKTTKKRKAMASAVKTRKKAARARESSASKAMKQPARKTTAARAKPSVKKKAVQRRSQ